jgi:hypothetical protein
MTTETPAQQIRMALAAKGYRVHAVRYMTEDCLYPCRLDYYVHPITDQHLVLETVQDPLGNPEESWELYMPVAQRSTIDDTIKAIP